MSILIALLVGFGLGWFYFGGLWLTVQQISRMPRSFGLMLLSFGLRLGLVVLAGYGLLTHLATQTVLLPLLACAAGFLLARNSLIARINRPI